MHNHHHAGPQPHGDKIGKLRTMLSYLLEHNREHVEDLRRWIAVSENVGRSDIVQELEEVIQLSESANQHIGRACELLGRDGEQERP